MLLDRNECIQEKVERERLEIREIVEWKQLEMWDRFLILFLKSRSRSH